MKNIRKSTKALKNICLWNICINDSRKFSKICYLVIEIFFETIKIVRKYLKKDFREGFGKLQAAGGKILGKRKISHIIDVL